MLAAKLAVKSVDLLLEGKTNRVVGIRHNEIIDEDITEALNMPHTFDKDLYDITLTIGL